MEPQIRPLQPADIPAVVEFSLRAWEPVFDSFRQVLGDDIYFAQYPDWLVSQAKDVERLCRDEAASVFVSVLQDLPVGFVGIVFHEDPPMGEVDMLAVDPDHQRRGLGLALTTFSLDHIRSRGITLTTIATGGDPGHAPARLLYEKAGLVPLPLVRYYATFA